MLQSIEATAPNNKKKRKKKTSDHCQSNGFFLALGGKKVVLCPA